MKLAELPADIGLGDIGLAAYDAAGVAFESLVVSKVCSFLRAEGKCGQWNRNGAWVGPQVTLTPGPSQAPTVRPSAVPIEQWVHDSAATCYGAPT